MKRPTNNPPIGLWTLSPRWSADPEPAIPFPTGQRIPIPNHVTSGPLSPRSFFHWSVVSHPKSRDFRALDQSEASHQNEAKWAIWAQLTTKTKRREKLVDYIERFHVTSQISREIWIAMLVFPGIIPFPSWRQVLSAIMRTISILT